MDILCSFSAIPFLLPNLELADLIVLLNLILFNQLSAQHFSRQRFR